MGKLLDRLFPELARERELRAMVKRQQAKALEAERNRQALAKSLRRVTFGDSIVYDSFEDMMAMKSGRRDGGSNG